VTGDQFPIRVVVLALGMVVVGGMLVIAYLATTQTAIPDSLDRLVFGALTAVTALLAKTSTTPAGGAPVEIVNDNANPVPVAEQPEG
jgi:hypothetical protein